jgi:hypothetical protein
MDTNEHEMRTQNPICRSGVSAERRQFQKTKECGFPPKAATLFRQKFLSVNSCLFVSIRG